MMLCFDLKILAQNWMGQFLFSVASPKAAFVLVFIGVSILPFVPRAIYRMTSPDTGQFTHTTLIVLICEFPNIIKNNQRQSFFLIQKLQKRSKKTMVLEPDGASTEYVRSVNSDQHVP